MKRSTARPRKPIFRNQGYRLKLLQSLGRIYFDPAQATVTFYTKQCSLNVSAKDLAISGRDALRTAASIRLDQGARRRSGDLPLRAGRDDDGRIVRNVRRLAL